jgi:multisubunit Na+/H+ antiporter MnhB subunit
MKSPWARILLLLGLMGLGVALARAFWTLPAVPPHLSDAATAKLDQSGVTHPLTAVLLNFRGYDTLLEIGVLLLAGLAARAVAGSAGGASRAELLDRPAVLVALVRVLAPALVAVAFYVLWIGSYRPGGAFQAGSILGAGGVLLVLAGLLDGVQLRWGGRLLLALGFLVFLLVAGAVMIGGNALLAYPQAQAGLLILLIEFSATLSIGLILTLLFLGVVAREDQP